MIKDYSFLWGSSTKWKKVFFDLLDNWWKSQRTKELIAKGSKRYNEASLTESLSEYLKKRLKQFDIPDSKPHDSSTVPDIRIRAQAGLIREIYEDAIEVKRGLSSTNEENRLFGQISKYCTKYNHCFVVICGGDIRSGLVTEVHRNLKEDNRKITAIWTPDKNLRF